MAAPPLLHRHFSNSLSSPPLHRHFTSSLSFPSPSMRPAALEPNLFISPKPSLNLSKTFASVSFENQRRKPTSFAPASHASDSEPESRENRVGEAREAVAEYLQKYGASREEANCVSSNCPSYLSMLIDGVDDLDGWNSLAAAAENVEFKRKVSQMAEQKGDKGVLPFLESIGLSLASASRLARYFSPSKSNALPRLIHKVEYMKEILFCGSDDGGIIGKNALRMMAHISISADDEFQQTLAFLEKIQARRGGLHLLGSENASFGYLIESFPRLLVLPLESCVKPIVLFLEVVGVPKECIRNIILLFPPVLTYDIDTDIKPRLRSFEKIGVKDTDLGKMLVKYPWILSASILENLEKILDFFDEEKVPRSCSSQAIKSWPHILGCSVSKMKLIVEELSKMDIKSKKLGHVIATSPQLLLRKPQELLQVVSFFKELGMDEDAIARTLGRCPEIFAANIDKTLDKKLEFLSNIGISKANIPRVVRKYPELFVCDVDRALLPRMRYLIEIGLSKKDVGFMVRRFSPLLGYSVDEVLRPKLEFLVKTMGRPVRDVVDYPRYFSYSLEKKIKPRYWVLKSRNIDFSLKEMLGKNDEEFADVYIGDGEVLVPPS
ncbi:transcription termination factor MTERF2, chloroplastic isoform X1 [Salvia hispanica]|uniref:transcription termination factor MTERF2, chloroplastic isoform X1 n=1 Tax=Salvia hispanica TaxID=49212 RepID=UPI00200900E7|nr:transcription termination factor MTERF2, chloroplastic isoform X1 [Salvia hispanica]